MQAKPTHRRPQTASLKLKLDDIQAQISPRSEINSNLHRTSTSTQPSERRHTRAPSSINLEKKAELLSVSSSNDQVRLTNLSTKSHGKIMHYLYGSPKERIDTMNLKFDSANAEYAFENLKKEEQDYLKSRYDEFKKQYYRMVFDKDRNLVCIKPSEKNPADRKILTDRTEKAKIRQRVEKIKDKVQQVTAEDTLEDAEEKGKMTRPKSTREFVADLKKKKLDYLDQKIRAHKIDTVIQQANREISSMAFKTGQLVDNVETQNESLKEANARLEKEVDELRLENAILKRTNQLLQQQILTAADEKDDLYAKCHQLEFFKPIYDAVKARFPEDDFRSIIRKYDQLQEHNYQNVKRIAQMEEEMALLKREERKQEDILKQKEAKIKSEQDERNKIITVYRSEIAGMESEIVTRRNYEKDYIELTNKILEIFSDWSSKLRVYFSFEKMPEINAKCRDPLEILDIMGRMVKIATPATMQRYLRSIIVSANQLRRKHFPQAVNTKYDPDKIYEMCSNHIMNLEAQIARLKNANGSQMSGLRLESVQSEKEQKAL